jgi:excisionase family DNA binding protein
MADRLITVREASKILGLSEKEIIDLVDEGKIPAYKIAGEFIRFRIDQIQQAKENLKLQTKKQKYNFREKLVDFLYFNDFYIFSIIIIIIILFFIFR